MVQKFAAYHPLLTEHFTLDWLTTTPLKKIQQTFRAIPTFQQQAQDYAGLTQALNQTLTAIMANQKLVWGISQRQGQRFIGQAGFSDWQKAQATLSLDLPSSIDFATWQELITFLTAFGQQTLELQQITYHLSKATAAQTHCLTELGYQQTDATWQWSL